MSNFCFYFKTELSQSYRYPKRGQVIVDDVSFGERGHLSVSGVAFAVSAVALTVLRTRDVTTSTSAMNLLNMSLPMSLDGITWIDRYVTTMESMAELRDQLIESNSQRIKHLLSVSDQVSEFFSSKLFKI